MGTTANRGRAMIGNAIIRFVLLFVSLLAAGSASAADGTPCSLADFDQGKPPAATADLQPPGASARSDLDTVGDQQVVTNIFLNGSPKAVTLLWMDEDTKAQVMAATYLDGGVVPGGVVCVRRTGDSKASKTDNSHVDVDGTRQDRVVIWDQPPNDNSNPILKFFLGWVGPLVGGIPETHRLEMSIVGKGADPDVAVAVTQGDGFAFAEDTFPGAAEFLAKLAAEGRFVLVRGTPLKLGLVGEKDGRSTSEFFAYKDYVLVTGVKEPVVFASETLGNTAAPIFLTAADGKPLLSGSLLLAPRRN